MFKKSLVILFALVYFVAMTAGCPAKKDDAGKDKGKTTTSEKDPHAGHDHSQGGHDDHDDHDHDSDGKPDHSADEHVDTPPSTPSTPDAPAAGTTADES